MWGLTNCTFQIETTTSLNWVARIYGTISQQFTTVNGAANQWQDVYRTVMEDLQSVRARLAYELDHFQTLSGWRENEAALDRRLLQLFQMDLLPGINAMIIESKAVRDANSAAPVTSFEKSFAWIFVVALNLAIMFYVYLFAVNQTNERQSAWFQTFIVWLLMEVFVISTLMVYVNHFLMPSLAMRDVQKVKQKLRKTILDFRTSIKRNGTIKHVSESETEIYNDKRVDASPFTLASSKNDCDVFNVADYFFVSNRVAKKYPSLLASKIILQFTSPWPHQSYLRTRSVTKIYSRKFATLSQSATMVVTFFLKGFLTMPPPLQDAFVDLVSIVVSGNFVTVLIRLYHINPLLPVLPILVIFLLVSFFAKMCYARGGDSNYDKRAPIIIAGCSVNSNTSLSNDWQAHNAIYQDRRSSLNRGLSVARELEKAVQRNPNAGLTCSTNSKHIEHSCCSSSSSYEEYDSEYDQDSISASSSDESPQSNLKGDMDNSHCCEEWIGDSSSDMSSSGSDDESIASTSSN